MKNRDYAAESSVYSAIQELSRNMSRWEDELSAVEAMPIGYAYESEHGTITKVDQSLDHSFDFDYNHVHIIFESDGRYFKYTGWKSSYGNSNWNDWVEEVVKKEETRVFYE